MFSEESQLPNDIIRIKSQALLKWWNDLSLIMVLAA